MAVSRLPADELRALLRTALPVVTATGASDDVAARYLYVPERHARALQRDVSIVRGIRGAGKTLWWKALQDEDLRQRVVDRMDSLRYLASARVITGFGAGGSTLYPSGRVVSHLLEQGNDAENIWRAIMLWGAVADAAPRVTDWSERVAWVTKEVERCDALFHRLNEALDADGRELLVLFDGLDRAGRAWSDVRKMLRGLFRLLVDLRELKRIRGKAFIRPEMLDTPEITSFQDASKLLNDAVDLEWRPTDLYGLLWQYLGNAVKGEVFREGVTRGFAGVTWTNKGNVWIVPDRMRRDPKLQEQVLTAIAGKYMGSNHRRGKVYTWLPNHLGDARRQVSPRSFLVALRHAADMSVQAMTALDHQAIREGVIRASQVRRVEIQEDQPWIAEALTPLEKLLVPTEEKTVLDAWRRAQLIQRLQQGTFEDRPSAPRYIEEGARGILRELEEIGVLGRSPDERIQMPDVYRIAFGLGRRGGVPPVKR
jgi:hypothetical protein